MLMTNNGGKSYENTFGSDFASNFQNLVVIGDTAMYMLTGGESASYCAYIGLVGVRWPPCLFCWSHNRFFTGGLTGLIKATNYPRNDCSGCCSDYYSPKYASVLPRPIVKTSKGYLFAQTTVYQDCLQYKSIPASTSIMRISSLAPYGNPTSVHTYGTAVAIQVAPNPTTAEITVRFAPTTAGAYSIDMFDMQGKQVISRTGASTTTTEQAVSIPIPHIPAGAYYVRLTTPKGIAMEKIIVER